MATKRCSDCNINFPLKGHRTCDGCGEPTSPVANAKPHPDWQERVAEVHARRVESAQTCIDAVWKAPRLDVELRERDGNLFISSHDVCRAGYQQVLQPESSVVIGDERYLVLGYVDTLREYWLLRASEEDTISE